MARYGQVCPIENLHLFTAEISGERFYLITSGRQPYVKIAMNGDASVEEFSLRLKNFGGPAEFRELGRFKWDLPEKLPKNYAKPRRINKAEQEKIKSLITSLKPDYF